MGTKKRRTYTKQEREDVLSAVREKGVCAAAKQYGVSPSCVSEWAKQAGVKRESAPLPQPEQEAKPSARVSPKRGDAEKPSQTPREPKVKSAAPSSQPAPTGPPRDGGIAAPKAKRP